VTFGTFQKASRARKPKALHVDEERPSPNSTSLPCHYCGSDAEEPNEKTLRQHAGTFQVIVACASCGAAFAALSRN
jgi:hypothetical protein